MGTGEQRDELNCLQTAGCHVLSLSALPSPTHQLVLPLGRHGAVCRGGSVQLVSPGRRSGAAAEQGPAGLRGTNCTESNLAGVSLDSNANAIPAFSFHSLKQIAQEWLFFLQANQNRSSPSE